MPAYYSALVGRFLLDADNSVVGELTRGYERDRFRSLAGDQISSWLSSVSQLRRVFQTLSESDPNVSNWGLLLEFPIPRREKRIDAVVLARDRAAVIELKEFDTADRSKISAAIDQVEDYARDLIEFHEPSRAMAIVPILVLHGRARASRGTWSDHTRRQAWIADMQSLPLVLTTALDSATGPQGVTLEELQRWNNGRYHPVPYILDAAADLYANHDVRDIASTAAGTGNLTATADALVAAVSRARQKGRKVICFVTGVPGAGKTLAGLNLIHQPAVRDNAAFLSGNGPLVKVLRESLARDQNSRSRAEGNPMRMADCRHEVETFIQNVHSFVHDNLPRVEPPHERIIVFDEAQRAWNEERAWTKNRRRQSEPATVLEIMDRHEDWAAIVALVGGGQEIHTGEAGLTAWGQAIRDQFSHWLVYASPEAVTGGRSVAGHRLGLTSEIERHAVLDERLHLAVSLRSIRSEKLAAWVNAVLQGDPDSATSEIPSEYPLLVTRSLESARAWLRENAVGTRRFGLVASSSGKRLRAHGIEVSSGFRIAYPYTSWFLEPPGHIDSSYQLEVAATEFEIQGLELDWVGLCWSADLSWGADGRLWSARRLSGNKWRTIRSNRDIEFAINRYRVLMTRARQGLIIWVPEGDPADPTRNPQEFDATYEYLRACGMTVLEDAVLRSIAGI